MAKYPSENTDAIRYFRTFLNSWIAKTGINKTVAAHRLGVAQGQLNELLNAKSGASINLMEKICANLRLNIVDALVLGRKLCGEEPGEKPLTKRQTEAKESFDFLLMTDDKIAEYLIDQTISLAQKKRAEAEDPFTKQGLKSAS